MKLQSAVIVLSVLGLIACGGAASDESEVAQAVGDTMASFDESSQGGAFAMAPIFKVPRLMRPSFLDQAADLVISQAHAATCSATSFSACSSGVRTKTFDSCS